jgi:hypothetical protein
MATIEINTKAQKVPLQPFIGTPRPLKVQHMALKQLSQQESLLFKLYCSFIKLVSLRFSADFGFGFSKVTSFGVASSAPGVFEAFPSSSPF